MKLYVAAVGTKMPGWVEAGFEEYAKRFPRDCSLELIEVRAEPRTTGKTPAAMMELEATRLRQAIPPRTRLVVLDERGEDMTSRKLSERLQKWQDGGDDVAFVIGGPDGLAPALKQGAHESMRLSSLTLPHAMVRVMLAEALYRAWSLLNNHPYHRD
ncbi:23S rRNA (pseudouridine(1915)-N(3))-methyltransferase RlmH [Uliginosibacterium sp. H3]|uniref:Ribosomal RNA large subunit methyltransferase H n=1 Tax=Uliginosibacterium silvisoli TaxID=3114758 RepID=A0ABU6K182_9RHOO|nr:23S rRNA (pseudouridine(1915)-N(3))-methyltransferase RlmH [Uliginosibacterium sp. H3]